jgi:hypothetical protein
MMAELIERITAIQRGGDAIEAKTIFLQPRRRRKVSAIARPLERVARRLIRAQILFGEEALRRHDRSTQRRRDGWLIDAPTNIVESGRVAYNEARKAVPFRLLPKL